jgi:hypothetical protein
MPKLPDAHFNFENDAEQRAVLVCKVHVDSDGSFTFALPAKIDGQAEDFGVFTKRFLEGNGSWMSKRMRCGYVSMRGASTQMAVMGPSHPDIKQFLDEALESFMQVTVTEEEVLCYRYASGLVYWIDPDGSIHPNGATGDRERGRWNDNERHSSRCPDKGISFAAYAMIRKTYTRGETKRVELTYFSAKSASGDDNQDIRAKLNAISPDVGKPTEDDSSKWTIIPYDEKAARFFYDIMHSLCRIDLKFTEFFGDRKQVAKAIASGKTNLFLT